MADEGPAYEARSTLSDTMNTALFGAGFGVVLSAIQNSLATHNRGAMGVLTRRSGGHIALYTAAAAAFGLSNSLLANVRQRDDTMNAASAACASGLVVGASMGSVPVMFGSCGALAALVGTFDAAARAMKSIPTKAEVGGEAQKEFDIPGSTVMRSVREQRRNAFFKKREVKEGEE